MPQPRDPNSDKLFKVREFLNDLNTNFRINYNPYREQAVDEVYGKDFIEAVHAIEAHKKGNQDVVQG